MFLFKFLLKLAKSWEALAILHCLNFGITFRFDNRIFGVRMCTCVCVCVYCVTNSLHIIWIFLLSTHLNFSVFLFTFSFGMHECSFQSNHPSDISSSFVSSFGHFEHSHSSQLNALKRKSANRRDVQIKPLWNMIFAWNISSNNLNHVHSQWISTVFQQMSMQTNFQRLHTYAKQMKSQPTKKLQTMILLLLLQRTKNQLVRPGSESVGRWQMQ